MIACTGVWRDGESYSLAISSSAGGSVSTPERAFHLRRGNGGHLVAEADEGYRLSTDWGCGHHRDVSDATTTITVNGDCSIMANFEAIPEYDLTISSTAGGSVSTRRGAFYLRRGTWSTWWLRLTRLPLFNWTGMWAPSPMLMMPRHHHRERRLVHHGQL